MTRSFWISRRRGQGPAAGFTLIEVLVALVLGALVTAMAGSALLVGRQAQRHQDDADRLDDSARYAMGVMENAVRQAGLPEPGLALDADLRSLGDAGSDALSGSDESVAGASAERIAPRRGGVNGSDMLALHFAGSGSGVHGDGSVVNCAGFGVGAERAHGDDGWSIFYVTLDRRGDAQLMCKYHGRHGWSSVALAAGVESFQVLYGIADTPAGVATGFVRATQLLQGAANSGVSAERIWQRVVSVRLSLLVRGTERFRLDPADQRFDLFGALYAQQDAMSDRGTHIDEATLPARQHGYLRRVFTTTTRLRNRPVGDVRTPNAGGTAI